MSTVQPVTDGEMFASRVAALFAEVLEVPDVGIDDSFFDLGGHSMLVAHLQLRLEEVFGVAVPLADMFDAHTPRELAKLLVVERGSVSEITGEIPLSFAQQRMWFLHQLAPEDAAYNLPFARRLRGPLDVERLRSALERTIHRHDALRTAVAERGGVPYQIVLPPARLELPATSVSEAGLAAAVQHEVDQPFDLTRPPLRARLFELAPDDHMLVIAIHHISADDRSLEIIWHDVQVLYVGATPSLLGSTYVAYAVEQRARLAGAALEEELGFWKQQLAGAPVQTELPYTARRTPAGVAEIEISLGAPATRALRELSRTSRATPFMTCLALVRAGLVRALGLDEVSLGVPISNRGRLELVGMFVNTLVLRTPVDRGASFRNVLALERERALAAYSHQDTPFELVVQALGIDRNAASNPLFQISFSHQVEHHETSQLGEARVEAYEPPRSGAQFDLEIETWERGDAVAIRVSYRPERFEPWVVEGLAAQLACFAREAVRDPDVPIAQLPILDRAERRRMVEQWNLAGERRDVSVPALFEAQVDRTPDAVAVVLGDARLTYRELDARANGIAAALRSYGSEPVVGIALERSFDQIAAILGVMKAGGAYVPLDPHLPVARLAYIAETSGVLAIVSRANVLLPGIPIVDVAAVGEATRMALAIDPDQLAYVIFTSGSTGKPKGVMVPHRAIANELACSDRAMVELGPGHAVLQLAPFTFDQSVHEILWPLVTGAALVLVAEGDQRDPQRVIDRIRAARVTVLELVPSLLRALVAEPGFAQCNSLALVAAGAEALPLEVARAFHAARPGVPLLNGYGPTEAAVTVCNWRVAPEADKILIGAAWPGVRFYVLDDRQEPVPLGVAGELYIGGQQLARGYVERPDLTAERFVPDPFAIERGARMYRVGDRVRRLPDGELEFLGRLDDQVKLRGFRIELGEIEAVLRDHPAVVDCVVAITRDMLAAYVVTREPIAALRTYLAARLPEYMVPVAYVLLDALPLTASGKLDRNALPIVDDTALVHDEVIAPRDDNERAIAKILCEVLELPSVSVRDDFFALGGHSLLATQVVARARSQLGVALTVRHIYDAPTVEGLAAKIATLAKRTVVVKPLAVRGEDLPLSYAQQRLWLLDRMFPGSTAYHIPWGRRIHGAVDHELLRRALEDVTHRHEILRTVFPSRGGLPVQRITPPGRSELPFDDLSGLGEVERREQLQTISREDAEQAFDLETGPLMRTRLVRLSAEEHIVMFTMHHIVADGWSCEILLRELAAFYRRGTLPPLPLQYADFAAEQRAAIAGSALADHLAHWKRQLADAPAESTLPIDAPRSAASGRAEEVSVRLGPEVTRAVRELGRREGATVFMTLLAAFRAVVARTTGQTDLVIGTPIANRERKDLEALIGLFVNTLVLRAEVDRTATLAELVRTERETVLAAQAHQDAPFEMIVDELRVARDPSRTPLFQIWFVQESVRVDLHRIDSAIADEAFPRSVGVTKFDLSVYINEANDDIELGLVFNADLFHRRSIAAIADRFVRALELGARAPDRSFAELELGATVVDPRAVIARPEYPPVIQVVEELALAAPTAPALRHRDLEWTRRELWEAAGRVAAALAAAGLQPGDRVALTGSPCPGLIAGFLGILRSGACFVPVSSRLAPEHVDRMLERVDARVLLHTNEVQAASVPTARIDASSGAVALPMLESRPGDPAIKYIYFTSGTTGAQKGVVGNLDALAQFSAWQRSTFRDLAVTAQLTELGFDVFLREVMFALTSGAVMALPPAELASLEPAELVRWLERERIEAIHTVPSLARSWLTHAPDEVQLHELRYVFVVGEPLDGALVERWRRRFRPDAEFINLYGTTETGPAKSWFRVPHPALPGVQPIGAPIPDTQLVLFRDGWQPCGVGEVGELAIRTPFSTLGYLDGGRFDANPFTTDPADIIYRTGDLGRYRFDGAVEILGRADDQIKLRGQRVDPAGIAATLRGHPAITDAAVIAARIDDDVRLAAYVVGSATTSELRDHLRTTIPPYMMPATFVVLEALPKKPNGKLDRAALPLPDWDTSDAEVFTAPRSPEEEAIAAIWCDVLALDRVGMRDDFFARGGHSLLAVLITSRVRAMFEVEIAIQRFFAAPTIEALAAEVVRLRSGPRHRSAAPIIRIDRTRELLPSFAQQRMWFLHRLAPTSAAYTVALERRLRGQLAPEALRRGFEEVVRRHEALRTVFPSRSGVPVQRILEPGLWELPIDDVSRLPAAERAAEVERIARREAERPFDLATGPLLRTRLVRIADDDHLLLVTLHHIVSDGWSMGVLWTELAELYRAGTTGAPLRLPELPIQYVDFAAWQRGFASDGFAEQLDYWTTKLADAPADTALPLARPRPAVPSARGGVVSIEIGEDITTALRGLGRRTGATQFVLLLAAFRAVLARATGQEDLCIGSPIANRNRQEVERMIGLMLNTLVLRTPVDSRATFTQLVRAERATALEAYAHQDVPFEMVVDALKIERVLNKTPLFQVSFVHQNMPQPDLPIGELVDEPIERDTLSSRFDLSIVSFGDRTVKLELVYNEDVLDRWQVEQLADQYIHFLREAVRDPEQPIARIPTSPTAARARLIVEWNRTAGEVLDSTLPAVFEAQVDRTPDAIALVQHDAQLTYRDLDRRANEIAWELRGRGVGPEVVVGISLERSFELVAAILGVTKAGGAWVPLDPHLPSSRLDYIAGVARPSVVISDPSFGAARTDRPPPANITGDSLAYVLFTSGSTGRPKGVMIHHRGIVNELVSAQTLRARLDGSDAFLQLAPYTFDLSVHEMLWPLSVGGRVVLLRDGEHREPARIVEEIRARGVTILHPVPTLLRALVIDHDLASCSSLRMVISGGEAMPLDVMRAFTSRRPDLPLVNSYGPTETSVTVSQWRCRADATAVAIGLPWLATQLYVLDLDGEPAALGIAGELYIGGRQVGRGYANQPALTAERFVPDPFGPDGARMYRTGDRARRWPDGNIELIGRFDGQVKLRGFRIELGEIDAVLREHEGVREVVVVVDGAGEAARLVAYVVGDWTAEAVRAHLDARLPEYMRPKVFVRLDAMPLTRSGKIDRAALPAPDGAAFEHNAYATPRTPIEEIVAGIWSELLGIDRIGRHDNFFDLGGHSLLAARLAWETKVPIATVFSRPTIAGLATAIEAGERTREAPPIVIVDRGSPLALSYAQQRMWFLHQLAASAAYHIGIGRRLRGALEVSALGRAIDQLIARHEILRTVFPAPGGVPHQQVLAAAPHALAVIDLTDHAEPEAELELISNTERERPFDLATGPLVRTVLVKLAPEEHVLLVTLHHIVADGWSVDVWWRELEALYAARVPAALAIQYADYAAWQREWFTDDVLEGQLAYWREKLRGAPEQTELPAKGPRPAIQSHHGAAYTHRIDRELASELTALARASGSTLFITLLAAFRALLYRYTGQDDLCIGAPIANRNTREAEALIGLFVNTLVLRTPVRANATFSDLLGEERTTALEAFAHGEAPFEMVVEALGVPRSLSRNPLFQVMFQLQFADAETAQGFAGLTASHVDRTSVSTQVDLDVSAAVLGDRIELAFVYNVDLFDREMIVGLAHHFHALLEAIVADPETAIGALEMVSQAECDRLVHGWNRSERGLPQRTLPALIDERCAATPDKIAISSSGGALTYRALRERSNQVAHHLIRRGVARDERVGLTLERGPDLVVAMLGVLKAGAAYLPLDTQLPPDRIAYMAADAGVRITIASLDELDESITDPAISIEPHHLAYVLYTSGSTGRPKGVHVEHGSLVNFLISMTDAPGLTERDTLLAVTTASFDISGLELYVPLLVGGCVLIATREEARDAARLQALVAGATAMQATPSTWRMLVETGWRGREDFIAMCGGEALPPDLAAELVTRVGALWNLYGPTETTIWSARRRIAAGEPIRLGEPIANTQLYVLDSMLGVQPLEVAGELFIGGDGLARGYGGRPDLTAERFVPDPFAAKEGARMYRTGDRVRRRGDGELEFLGRIDHQVKVRGFRIELGEIEAVLGEHPSVAEAVVVVREHAGEPRLVAYVVAIGKLPAVGELLAAARERLPDYMIPTAVVVLDELPLSPAGKIDRKALPEPDHAELEGTPTAPRSPIEEILVGIWSELLGTSVGIHDDFFARGGHSLLAVRVVWTINRTFAISLPLDRLFAGPTIAALAPAITAAIATTTSPPAPAPADRVADLPLSYSQQRMWFLHQLDPGSAAYNIATGYRVRGPLDVEALRGAIEDVVHRHEALRTVFPETRGVPRQVVRESGAWELAIEDADLAQVSREDANAPFDLATDALLRTRLIRLGPEDHVLLATMHHIVADGWSLDVFWRDLERAYLVRTRGEPAVSTLPIQYADYAVWQRRWLEGEALEAQLAYWRERLATVPHEISLPLEGPRPARQTFRGDAVTLRLDREMLDGLRAVARREHATLVMALLAATRAVLSRYSGQTDFCIGVPTANRSTPHVEDLIGLFVNTVAMRTIVDPDAGFAALVASERATALGAYAHQDTPIEMVIDALGVARALDRNPLFQIQFQLGFESAHTATWGEPVDRSRGATQLDLDIAGIVREDELELALGYNADLFDREMVEDLARHLERFVREAVAAPDRRISALPVISLDERTQFVRGGPARDYTVQPLAHQLFEAQVDRTPEASALTFEAATLSYRELDERVNRLAHHLLALGARADAPIGVRLERSLEMIVALLAIMKAGAPYLPIDPAYPAQRVTSILEDGGCELVIDRAWLVAHAADIAASPAQRPDRDIAASHAAYVIFTSGSTGRPKGVVVQHAGLRNRLLWTSDAFAFDATDVMLQKTPFTFDVSVFELFYAFTIGARLVVARPDGHRDPAYLGKLIRDERITYAHFVPSMLGPFLDELDRAPCPSLRRVFASGEALSIDLVRAFAAKSTAELHNLYGPTEATVEVSWWPCKPTDDAIPIGHPIANTRLYVLDREHEPAPAGVTGELFLAGIQLARGYSRRPDLTAERFLPDPFYPGERMYRTGDLARRRRDGAIEYLGRIDHQVKIRGLRIELEEVEIVLRAHPNVREAVATAHVHNGAGMLVAYIVGDVDEHALREHARAHLPEYMVPSVVVMLDELPLTTSGKTDRNALPEPVFSAVASELGRPRDPAEEILVGIWVELLGIAALGIHDNFFELGGHSLLAVRMLWAVNRTFDVELTLDKVFTLPTIAQLATAIAATTRGTALPPPSPVERTSELPLSYAQQRMWFLQQLDPASTAYNITTGFHLRGDLDVEALRGAFEDLVARHESLRTVFPATRGVPRQQVLPPPRWELVLETDRPFDLATELPLRTSLTRIASDDHVLLATMHHIAADGWSQEVLWSDLERYYLARTQSEAAPAALPIQYADYAVWQRRWLAGDVLERELAHWKHRLAGAPQETALPIKGVRPPRQTFRGEVVTLELDRGVLDGLRDVARQENATLVMVMLAALRAVLYRYTGQDDLCIGMPTANRRVPQIDTLIGLFVNTIVMRTTVDPDRGFADLVARERATALEAYAHEDAPFEMVIDALGVERVLDRNPLFQVMFHLAFDRGAAPSWAGLVVEDLPLTRVTTQLDLDVAGVVRERGLELALTYNADLFDRAAIEAMARHLESFVRAAVADPDRRIGELALITGDERAELVRGGTARDYSAQAFTHERIEQQVDRTPDAPAVTFEGTTLTYRELDERANQLARLLGADAPIGVCLDRSLDLIVAVLAIMKAGAPYVPIDPSYPAQRIAAIRADGGCDLVIDAAWLAAHRADIAASSPRRPSRAVDGDDAAYVIFTSGSTGRPKGVVVTHAGLRNRLLWVGDTFAFDARDVLLQKTPFTFDVSVFELFYAFTIGARLVVARPDGHRDPAYLGALIRDERVTFAHFVPSMLGPFVDELRRAPCPSLRRVFASGEALSIDLVRAFAAASTAELHNLYGPTEATVDVSWWPCSASDDTVPIGNPVTNTRLYVLDREHRPVPAGITGELFISGIQLARGYSRRPDLTAERFVPDPFTPGERMYRTGDLARRRRDGALEYLGRIDHQVKIRGLRIELEEVEAVLRSHAGVREVVASVHQQLLVAYIVGDVAEESLREHARAQLPEYMVPSVFVTLDELPITSSGKTDRKALPAPTFASTTTYVAPRTEVEHELTRIWAQVLGLPRVGIRDRFFDIGGHSLLAIRLLWDVNRAFDAELPLAQIFATPTIEQLAPSLAEARGSSTTLAWVRSGLTTAPATPLQRAFHDIDRDDPHNEFGHSATGIELTGPLDRNALVRALEAVVERHEILRTTYRNVDGVLMQFVNPTAAFELELVGLTGLPGELRAARHDAQVAELVHRRFDLASGPIVRASLTQLAIDRHVLVLVVHHCAVDGASTPTLLDDITTLYAHFNAGGPEPAPELQYIDFADDLVRHDRSPTGRADHEYWVNRLAGAPDVELPIDFERSHVDRKRDATPRGMACYATHSVTATVSADLRDRLARVAEATSSTMMMVLMSGFAATLHGITHQPTLCFQTTLSQRHDRQLERVIGPVANPVIIRIDAIAPNFEVLAKRTRDAVVAAFEHGKSPVISWASHRIRRINFNFNPRTFGANAGSAEIAPGLVARDFVVPLESAKTPFDVHLWLFERADGIGLRMLGNAEVFERETCETMLRRFVELLDEVA